jgi:hypothetical protein
VFDETDHDVIDQFDFASSFFQSDVAFTIFNCSNNTQLCQRRKIPKNGYITLYSSAKKSVLLFDSLVLAYKIVDFVSSNTFIPLSLEKQQAYILTSNNFHDFVSNNSCSIIFFVKSDNAMSNILMDDINQLAHTFIRSKTASVGVFDCLKFHEFCISQEVYEVPAIFIYPSKYHFKGHRLYKNFLEFSNEKCNEFRLVNGDLNSEGGTNRYLESYVAEFMKAKRSKIIKEVKTFEKGVVYSFIMKRILEEGEERLDRMIESQVKKLANNPHGSKTRDDDQIYLNILRVFEKHKTDEKQHSEL